MLSFLDQSLFSWFPERWDNCVFWCANWLKIMLLLDTGNKLTSTAPDLSDYFISVKRYYTLCRHSLSPVAPSEHSTTPKTTPPGSSSATFSISSVSAMTGGAEVLCTAGATAGLTKETCSFISRHSTTSQVKRGTRYLDASMSILQNDTNNDIDHKERAHILNMYHM